VRVFTRMGTPTPAAKCAASSERLEAAEGAGVRRSDLLAGTIGLFLALANHVIMAAAFQAASRVQVVTGRRTAC
jgi:hypothetical protein